MDILLTFVLEMGSEKKRKRVSSDFATEGTPSSLEKSERKKLKKLKRASLNQSNDAPNEEIPENGTEMVPLVSPIATRKLYSLQARSRVLA